MFATSSNRLITVVGAGDLGGGSIVFTDAGTTPGSCGDPGAVLGVCGGEDDWIEGS